MDNQTTKDMLELLFEEQASLNRELTQRRGAFIGDRDEWMQRLAIALQCELSETVEELNYKWWKDKKPVNDSAVKEELVDILHFFLSMCIQMDMDAKELFELYTRKNKINLQRQDGLTDREGYASPKTR